MDHPVFKIDGIDQGNIRARPGDFYIAGDIQVPGGGGIFKAGIGAR